MKFKWFLLVLIFAFASAPAVVAQDTPESCDLVYLFDAWARATPEGATTSAVYGLLVNLSAEEDTLVSASTEAAEAVELHEIIMGEGDVMQMRPVEGGFAVTPGGLTELKPGGYHIMLINLTAPLVAGETLDLTLTFENAGEISLTVPVQEAPVEGEMSMGADMTDESETEMADMEEEAVIWPEACANIYVVDGWVRPAGAGMPSSAAYGLLVNLTEQDDVLISAVSDVSEAVELHEMIMGAGDVMQMRPIEGGISVPAGGTARLQPGGLHVMFINLTRELPAGEMVEVTLTFAESDPMTLLLPVRDPNAETAPMSMGG